MRARASTTLSTRSAIARFSRAIAEAAAQRQHLEIAVATPAISVSRTVSRSKRVARSDDSAARTPAAIASPQVELVARAQRERSIASLVSQRPPSGRVSRGATVSAPRLSIGKSDAPAMRTCASAWRTRSAAIARSGLRARAPRRPAPTAPRSRSCRHQSRVTAERRDRASCHASAPGGGHCAGGLAGAAGESMRAQAPSDQRRQAASPGFESCARVMVRHSRRQRHDRIDPRRLARRHVAEHQPGGERAAEGEQHRADRDT